MKPVTTLVAVVCLKLCLAQTRDERPPPFTSPVCLSLSRHRP